ncbi:MAG TPA: NAD(P)-dependent oxidoreductase [Solirubrobacterales bacterium]|jgi:3-hydroxyisobutyrate dehydrogenase-like beta-hydroxyacid dehydrogenase
MSNVALKNQRLGWVGTGRMGFLLAKRLLEAGCDVSVYNRTRSKAEPLVELGATIADSPAELGDRDIVFTMVADSADFEAVVLGENGLLSRRGVAPGIIVDSTTISAAVAADVRAKAAEYGAAILAAPVSGNPKVVKAGKLTIVVSGPGDAFEQSLPFLEAMAAGVTYVGEGDLARLVKICHNVMLGVVSQCMAEITVLAEKGGVPRSALLEFLNQSVMGSVFTRYKTPSFVNLDFKPTFTPPLLLKDLDLGLEAARESEVPMPVTAATAEVVSGMIASGYREVDFSALLEVEAKAAGLELESEDVIVGDGLSDAPSSDGAVVGGKAER